METSLFRGLAALEIGVHRNNRSNITAVFSLTKTTLLVLTWHWVNFSRFGAFKKKQRVDWRGAKEGKAPSVHLRPRRHNFEIPAPRVT